jgi:aromatic ring-cleaving dioxygenase
MSKEMVDKIHEYKEQMTLDVFYPGHPPRKETALYARTHKAMCITEDQPCWICGVRNTTLHNKSQNPWKSKALETHHFVVEDSLAEAVDLVKFNARLVYWHRCQPHHDPQYDTDFTQEQMEEWIHGDRDNMRVLCDVHHRSTAVGIHHMPYPFWAVQDLIKEGFKYTELTPT